MIRQANKFDIPVLAEMLWHYHASGNLPDFEIESDETGLKILSTIIAGAGIALVSEQENEVTGMLLAICAPFMWDHKKLVMNEIAFWVEPEHRGGTAGYRLMKEYLRLCDEMKESGRIQFCTMSQMEGQELNYARFGLKPIEHTWSL